MIRDGYKSRGYRKPDTNRAYSGINISKICNKTHNDKYKEENRKVNKEDTEIRSLIQKRISDLLQLGFPKDQIVIRLKNEFPNSKYEEFFEGWVEHKLNKMRKDDIKINRDDLGRFK